MTRRWGKIDRSVIDPTHQALPSCSIAVKAGAPREGVAAEERPALTASARAGLRQYAVGAGESLRGAVEQEKGQEERKIEKRARGGLDTRGAHISRPYSRSCVGHQVGATRADIHT